MVTYPADKSREAMPTLSPRACGERDEMRKNGKQGAIRAVTGSRAFHCTCTYFGHCTEKNSIKSYRMVFLEKKQKTRKNNISWQVSLVAVATMTESVPRSHE